MKVIVLCSGGMDSIVALYSAHEQHEIITALSFHYGSRHNDREIPCAAYHAKALKLSHCVIPLDFIGKFFSSHLLHSGGDIPDGHYQEATMQQTVVPFRNGIMLAAAAGFAESRGADGVVIAAHGGDHAIYPDCREDFMQAMETAISKGTYKTIKLLRPFISATKTDLVLKGAKLGIDFSRTYSCYKGEKRHCGACGTCVERREAFELARVTDPTDYISEGPLPRKPTTTSPPCREDSHSSLPEIPGGR